MIIDHDTDNLFCYKSDHIAGSQPDTCENCSNVIEVFKISEQYMQNLIKKGKLKPEKPKDFLLSNYF